MEEEKKAAILEKRNKGAAAKLPNLLTKEEVMNLVFYPTLPYPTLLYSTLTSL